MYFIGVDLGTSAVKLLLMDENGKIEKIVSKEYPLYFPHPGWSEQKPEDWFAQSMAGIKELVSECDRTQVKGISFGGQMHGLVALDENDEVIGYEYVNLGLLLKNMQSEENLTCKQAFEKSIKTYGRFNEGKKFVNPRGV